MRLSRFLPLVVFLALTGLLFRGLSIDPTALPAARLGAVFPAFQLPELASDELVGVDALLPGPALVNVWATWCYSCRVEHPYLLQLAAAGIPIYGLNYKDESEPARQWLAQLGDPYRLTIVDTLGDLGLDLGVYGAPETYVLDQTGRIVHRHVGVLDQAVFERDIQPFFAVSPGGEGLSAPEANP
jgi:cytochrome c biogenesis protein CcmG/thiol:disulfide interchange protein DsbE